VNGNDPVQMAYEAILAGDFEKAIGWFQEAVRSQPDNASYHYKLSVTCARSNRLAQAIAHARKALELENKPQYRYHLQILQAKERREQARRHFGQKPEQLHMAVALLQEAVDLDPLEAESFFLLAAAYAGLGEYAPAVRALKELLRLDPRHEDGKKLLDEYSRKWQLTLHS